MPCTLPDDEDIPLGQYGRSNVGRAKTIYRMGLSHRYGRRMQTISGIHYNFSLPDRAWTLLQRCEGRDGDPRTYRDEAYFALIRNFRRHTWLLLYLFGASPAVCRSFVEGREHSLETLADATLYLPHATSLRMGPLGYQSDAQRSLKVSYNSLASYARSIRSALLEPYPDYEAIGVRDGSGRYRQLSTTLLQIENEFYGTIRPKRRINSGERPLHALADRGVEYVEVRCIDVDPFSPIGIEPAMMRFLDIFLLHCLLSDSPPDDPDELVRVARNQHRAAQYGREPGEMLIRGDGKVALVEWAAQLLAECEPIASALDAAHATTDYGKALASARAALANPANTPSARVLKVMATSHENAFKSFALAQSLRHRDAHLRARLPDEIKARYETMAKDSLAAQRIMEHSDTESFETFLRNYLAPEALGVELA